MDPTGILSFKIYHGIQGTVTRPAIQSPRLLSYSALQYKEVNDRVLTDVQFCLPNIMHSLDPLTKTLWKNKEAGTRAQS